MSSLGGAVATARRRKNGYLLYAAILSSGTDEDTHNLL
jgi:hypothetical protein